MLYPTDWQDYELIDCGEGEKLERWGGYMIVRPDPRIIWKKSLDEREWKTDKSPESWKISYKDLRLELRQTNFGHVGVFPEQATNWEWEREKCLKHNAKCSVLNLFAYTGGASLACAQAGAEVTHVDASRPAITWARQNAQLTGVENKIRWIEDDVVKFVNREIKRGKKYEGIIMDPPRFGRGVKGEVWKLTEDLPKLVKICGQVLSATPLFFLINVYTSDLSPVAVGNLLTDIVGENVESGELGLKDRSGKLLPCGVFARWNSPKIL